MGSAEQDNRRALGRLADQPGPGETETHASGQTSSAGSDPYPWLSLPSRLYERLGGRYDVQRAMALSRRAADAELSADPPSI